MKYKLNYTPMNEEMTGYIISGVNDKYLGQLIMLEDGYFYWFPQYDYRTYNVCLDNYVIKDISLKLDELNEQIEKSHNEFKSDNNNPDIDEVWHIS